MWWGQESLLVRSFSSLACTVNFVFLSLWLLSLFIFFKYKGSFHLVLGLTWKISLGRDIPGVIGDYSNGALGFLGHSRAIWIWEKPCCHGWTAGFRLKMCCSWEESIDFGTSNVLVCTCTVLGKTPWSVTEFHVCGLDVKNDWFSFRCTLSPFSATLSLQEELTKCHNCFQTTKSWNFHFSLTWTSKVQLIAMASILLATENCQRFSNLNLSCSWRDS